MLLRSSISRLKRRLEANDNANASDLVNTTSASVRVLLDPATVDAIELHPGLFPLFRRLQINLALLMQMGLCTPDRMLRVNAMLIGIKPNTPYEKMGRKLNKALEFVQAAGQGGRSGHHQATFTAMTGLYEAWWLSAWHCPLQRIDVLHDIITDMRRNVHAVVPSSHYQGRGRFKYGNHVSLRYGGAEQPETIDDPRNALTVFPGTRLDYADDDNVYSTVHSSTPVRFEYTIGTPAEKLFPPPPRGSRPRIQDGHLFSPPELDKVEAEVKISRAHSSLTRLEASQVNSSPLHHVKSDPESIAAKQSHVSAYSSSASARPTNQQSKLFGRRLAQFFMTGKGKRKESGSSRDGGRERRDKLTPSDRPNLFGTVEEEDDGTALYSQSQHSAIRHSQLQHSKIMDPPS